MLHVVSTQCVADDLHTNEPGHLRFRVGDSLPRSEEIVKKSSIAPLNTIRSSISSSSMCINAFTARQEKRGEKQSSWRTLLSSPVSLLSSLPLND